jgi:Tol biopolymer transport system component
MSTAMKTLPSSTRALAPTALLVLLFCVTTSSFGSFVYETPAEFTSSGDFNGDGRLDALVLDKATGNARVGFQDASGALTWSPPVPTGVAQAGSLAVGRFIETNRQAIAVTSLELNRIHVLDLSSPSNAPAPLVFRSPHAALTMLVGLEAPYGASGLPAQHLDWTAAGTHDPGITLLDLLLYSIGDGLAVFQDQIVAPGYLESGNSLELGGAASTVVAGMARGSNDTFAAYSYVNQSNVLYRVDLHGGTEYVFGRFRWGRDTETAPGLFFYVPGESNIIAQRVLETANGFTLSAPTITAFASAIQRVYYVDEGTNGVGIVQFGDGAVGVRPASGSDQLEVTYGFGAGAAGNVMTGVVPLGSGKFALLSGVSNTFSSAQAQTFTKSGSNYVQTSTSTLSKTTSNGTRANVWLFAREPFVSANPAFVASLHAGDWISSVSGLPGGVSVVAETDRGVTNGLGNPTSQNLASPSLNATYGIANQYLPTISLFSYSSPRAAEPVMITIAPPPGHYEDPIAVSFTTADASDHVFYRVGAAGTYQEYTAPFALATNSSVQFYGTTASDTERSSLQLASYTFTPKPDVLNTNSSGTTNPPVTTVTNDIATYSYGTVIYGRRSGSAGSIWAIHLDGSGDHYITQGVRPRVSPDGRFLAFLREGNPFNSQGNLWIRDLETGQEYRLFVNSDYLVFYDWDRATMNLFFDYSCQLWRADLAGNVVALPMANDCNDDAPTQNPIDGRLAFHNLNPNPAIRGLYVAPADGSSKTRLNLAAANPRWAAWSPDGELLAFADGTSVSLEAGRNLWVVKPDGTGLSQISGFTDTNGFRYGALWSPESDALVGAATIGGVNGVWIVPLGPDRDACGGDAIRLPTTPGDAIDFVGSVFVPPPPPKLFIRREQDEVIVSWHRTAWSYVLQAASEPAPTANWVPINGPYALTNSSFEYHMPIASLPSAAFFRLQSP